MLNELLSTFLLRQLSTALLPTDGAVLEASVQGKEYAESAYGERGGVFNAYLQFVDAHAPVKVDRDSLGIVTTAKSSIVVDADTGLLLYGERPYDVRSIGSVTKLMTVMVFLDTQPNLDDMVTLDPAQDLVGGGRQYVAFYDGITIRDLLGAVLVGSDNSGAESLVRFSGMTDEAFVVKMNEKAKELGLSKTYFTDPTGIRATNVSTAFDLARLLAATDKYPVMRTYMQSATYTFAQASGRGVTVENTNDALRAYQGDSAYRIVAGKTGYLPESGYVLASAVESRGKRVYAVVMDSDTKELRSVEMRALAEWAFRVYRWPNEL